MTDIFINILVPIICFIIGYLFGSIPFSIIIGKVFFHQDPRDYGSKNAGGTNAGRIWGKKVGFIVIFLDMLKIILPMWICWAILTYVPINGKPLIATTEVYYTELNSTYVIQWPVYLITNIGCVVGHCWPCFARFKGGKAVASFMGTVLSSSWALGIIPTALFAVFLKRWKYVSKTALFTSLYVSIFAWIWAILVMTKAIPHGYEWIIMYGCTINPTWHFALTLTICSLIMFFRHRENIKRLIAGTERKITWMK